MSFNIGCRTLDRGLGGGLAQTVAHQTLKRCIHKLDLLPVGVVVTCDGYRIFTPIIENPKNWANPEITMIGIETNAPLRQTDVGRGHENKALRNALEKLEARFLAEMLKAARFGETPATMGGGIGEDQFSSYLTNAHAEALAARGGIGLAEQIFQVMTRTRNDDRTG
jgi:hypothetical protein